ncbi:MAG: hypothetical protein HYU64_18720, partial [Armatimonadetes bacterium]|nr:hypothetical protein [Armatimonadota bacterium]
MAGEEVVKKVEAVRETTAAAPTAPAATPTATVTKPADGGGGAEPHDDVVLSQPGQQHLANTKPVDPPPADHPLTPEEEKQRTVDHLIDRGLDANQDGQIDQTEAAALSDEERKAIQEAYGPIPLADVKAMEEAGFKIRVVDSNDPKLTGGENIKVYGNTVLNDTDGGPTIYLNKGMFDGQYWQGEGSTPEMMDSYRNYIIRHETGHAMFAINYNKYGDDFVVKVANQYIDAKTSGEQLPSYLAGNNPLHFYTETYAANYTPDNEKGYRLQGLTIHGKEAVPQGMEEFFAAQGAGQDLKASGVLGRTDENQWYDKEALQRYYTGRNSLFKPDGSSYANGEGPYGSPWRWDTGDGQTY